MELNVHRRTVSGYPLLKALCFYSVPLASRSVSSRDVMVRPDCSTGECAGNMVLSRVPGSTEKDYARLEEYERVREILLAGPDL